MNWILRWWSEEEIRAACEELGTDEAGLVALAERCWEGGTLADLIGAVLQR